MEEFNDIRSFRDDEIPAAMRRMAQDAAIPRVVEFLDFGMDAEHFRQFLCNIKTVKEFQAILMRDVVEKIMQQTTAGLGVSGIEDLDPTEHYLFVSNHRDIVLDAMFIDYALLKHGFPLLNIAFGNNLVFNPMANDFAKCNKMFQMERGGSKMEFYRNLTHVSDYIRHLLVENNDLVWIAQRNGRTKDGRDATDPAVIKMLAMSRRDDRVASLDELHIVPVSVSYEWESCDMLKTKELYVSRFQKYEKQPGEDLNSIITGVKQPKGRVHIHFGKMLTKADFEKLKDCASAEFYKKVAAMMDAQINGNYVLYPNNYIAFDLRNATVAFADQYTYDQKAEFENYMRWMDDCTDFDKRLLREIFLGIYANPVENHMKDFGSSQR